MTVEQIMPHDAYGILQDDPNSVLVDVRTKEELISFGQVDLSRTQGIQVNIAWKFYPAMQLNKDFNNNLLAFLSDFSAAKNAGQKKLKLLFMCAAGARSSDAANNIAALGLGYECYNIIGGFEGRPDKSGQKGTIDGWKAEKLPWRFT